MDAGKLADAAERSRRREDVVGQRRACMVKKTSSMTMPTMKGRRLVTPPLGGWMNIAPKVSRGGDGPPRGALRYSIRFAPGFIDHDAIKRRLR